MELWNDTKAKARVQCKSTMQAWCDLRDCPSVALRSISLGQSCTNADACAARIVEQNLIFVFFAPKPHNFHHQIITNHITTTIGINFGKVRLVQNLKQKCLAINLFPRFIGKIAHCYLWKFIGYCP
jgi:hypothetical protein